jgi:hypothetical protein
MKREPSRDMLASSLVSKRVRPRGESGWTPFLDHVSWAVALSAQKKNENDQRDRNPDEPKKNGHGVYPFFLRVID